MVGAIGGLLALQGQTWDDSKKGVVELTLTGWSSFLAIVLGAAVAAISVHHAARLVEVAAAPVYSRVVSLAETANQSALIHEVAMNKGDPRSPTAREIIALDEYHWAIRRSCDEFIETWQAWRLETDLRLRGDLEMVSFFCQSKPSQRIELIRDASTHLRRRICEIASYDRACNPKTLREIEEDLDKVYFSKGAVLTG